MNVYLIVLDSACVVVVVAEYSLKLRCDFQCMSEMEAERDDATVCVCGVFGWCLA